MLIDKQGLAELCGYKTPYRVIPKRPLNYYLSLALFASNLFLCSIFILFRNKTHLWLDLSYSIFGITTVAFFLWMTHRDPGYIKS